MSGYKTKVNILLLCVLNVAILIGCAPKQNTMPKNEYGLQVIGKVKTYKLTVQTDSLKRVVALKNYVSPLITDWKYATNENFTRLKLYKNPAVYVRIEAALALEMVQNELIKKGLSLKFFDAYRPYSVTKKMWKVVP